jgi:hypothetical protein
MASNIGEEFSNPVSHPWDGMTRLGDSAASGTSQASTGSSLFENEGENDTKNRGKGRGKGCLGRGASEHGAPACSLGPDELGQLTRVTHLNVRELRTVDQLFNLLVEIAQAIGEPVKARSGAPNTPRRGAKHGPTQTPTYALSVKQLRRLRKYTGTLGLFSLSFPPPSLCLLVVSRILFMRDRL